MRTAGAACSARRWTRVCVFGAVGLLAGCGDASSTGPSQSNVVTTPDPNTVTLQSASSETTLRDSVDSTSSVPGETSTTTTGTAQPVNDGRLRVEESFVSEGAVCAAVTLDDAASTFCSPRADFFWSIGERVFIFATGPELRLRDGRVLLPEPGENFIIHEIVNAEVDHPVHGEPDFCPLTAIAFAFQRYAPGESFGWGGGGCISDELFGVGVIAGVDQAGFGEVMGGIGGTDRFVGFVARLDGTWTVLELLPEDEFAECNDLTVPTARELCARSQLSWNETATS